MTRMKKTAFERLETRRKIQARMRQRMREARIASSPDPVAARERSDRHIRGFIECQHLSEEEMKERRREQWREWKRKHRSKS